jgi:hypothetical protein
VAGVNESFFPVGVSVGWRHALGATRAFSVYAAPFYGALHVPANSATGTTSTTKQNFYGSVGADVAVLPQVGLTLGYQAGGASWSKGVFGVAVSYALSHR